MSAKIPENKKDKISRKKTVELFDQLEGFYKQKRNVDFDFTCCKNNKEWESGLDSNEFELVLQNKEIKRAYKELEARLNAIFSASIDGIIIFDTRGTILSINRAVINIFGYSEEELIAKSFNMLLAFAERKKRHFDIKTYLQDKLASDVSLISGVDGKCKNGSYILLDISLVKCTLNGADCYVTILRDAGFLKKREQQEQYNLEQLTNMINFFLKDEMGVSIVHEINQPLTAIVNYAQAVLRFFDTNTSNSEQIRETLLKINQQALKAKNIIQHTKDFVYQPALYRANKNINVLIEEVVGLCINDLDKNNIKVKVDLAKNIPDVVIDDVQIEQVLLNLFRNSIEALRDLKQEKKRHLSVQSYLTNLNLVEIRIKDNGIGINEAFQKKILSPFYSTKQEGMGIGLSLSRLIIEAHNGVLYFNSKPEKGCTFYFTLPIKGDLVDSK